jgi:hypothetical protein
MAKRRKTRAELESKREAAVSREWDEFRLKFAAIASFVEAQLLVQRSRPGSPGRHFYSNLGFFLGEFAVPHGAGRDELVLYLEFIQRIDAAGQLKPDVGKNVERALQDAIVSGRHF